MTTSRVFAGALACGLIAASAASAQSTSSAISCGATGTPPVIKPIIKGEVFIRDDPNFDCHLWQTFIYLNWPAKPGARGVPDSSKQFGAAAPTVWETYPTVEQTFLPGARDPGPWDQSRIVGAAVPQGFAARVAGGSLRALSRESKVSREVIANLGAGGTDPDILRSITQAFGGVLYDQNRKPVYYEIAMNEDQYTYIQKNGLYNADTQLAFATSQTIALPTGATSYGKAGAIELKAAWKILGPQDDKSKFHTAQAIVVGTGAQSQPVTVGLVGLHIVHMAANMSQAAWGTFAHVDNAPLNGHFGNGPYNFYNPGCRPFVCPPNNRRMNPTQVVQMNPDGAPADAVNEYMKSLFQKMKPVPVWQYYKLINVQWPLQPVELSSLPVPAMRPLPLGGPNLGGPNSPTPLMNPVLETFMQFPKTSCLGCHIDARISHQQSNATDTAANNASSYSFMFSYADAPRKE
jgi:hypothetical protein